MHLKVWFILVDSNGEPYNGNRESFVFLSDDPTIAEFRSAVCKEYERSELKHISASRLKVYMNKSDLESKEEYKSGNSREILRCGADDTLLVVVPDSITSVPIQVQTIAPDQAQSHNIQPASTENEDNSTCKLILKKQMECMKFDFRFSAIIFFFVL
jgi:hypothetical protein